MPSGLVRRARIVLLAAEGVPNAEIARRLEVSRQTVVTWRNRFRSAGPADLDGRPAAVRATAGGRRGRGSGPHAGGPPERLGVTHWSS
ncbi:helix-turn-helix domain-containing protein [Actinomadura sp. NTSP31]|uniref:helix-turn-helix domain-containing protein n=1 Tax=Actinomadura sp. NTSP31 TaxID=1735447 RepID=UPI0035C0409A